MEDSVLALSAKEFLSFYNTIKKFLGEGKGSDELKARFESITKLLHQTYDPDSFKSAVTAGEMIPTPLEEELTSAKMLFLREQSQG